MDRKDWSHLDVLLILVRQLEQHIHQLLVVWTSASKSKKLLKLITKIWEWRRRLLLKSQIYQSIDSTKTIDFWWKHRKRRAYQEPAFQLESWSDKSLNLLETRPSQYFFQKLVVTMPKRLQPQWETPLMILLRVHFKTKLPTKLTNMQQWVKLRK